MVYPLVSFKLRWLSFLNDYCFNSSFFNLLKDVSVYKNFEISFSLTGFVSINFHVSSKQVAFFL